MAKKIVSLIFALIISGASLGGFSVFAETFDISIIHTADMSGNIFKNEEKGTVGYGNVLSVKEHIGSAIVVDCGNFLGETSQKTTGLNGRIVYAMNEAGYKYATLGYNDIKYSKAHLDEILSTAEFEIISSNLKVGETYPYAQYKTEMINGIKIGIFAITDAESTADFLVEDPEVVAGNMTKKLKAGGAKVIFAIINSKDLELSKRISTQNPNITIVLEGGTEEFKPQGEVNGRTLIVNPGSKGNAVGVSAVKINGATLQSFQTSNYNLSNIKEVYPDTNTLEEEMQAAQSEIDAINSDVVCVISEPLAYNKTELTTQSTPLGNFTADVIRNITKADFAIVRGSDIKSGFSKGITTREINEVFNENDSIVVKEISGKNLNRIMEISLNKIIADENGNINIDKSQSDKFLQISGFRVEYNTEYKAGKRIVSIKTDKGKKIGSYSNKKYTLAVSKDILDSYSEYLNSAESLESFDNITTDAKKYLANEKEITVDTSERISKTDKNKSFMWIVWLIAGSFFSVLIIFYVVAQIVMMLNRE